MAQSAGNGSVRVLPNNKVYRQLFDAQVQLSDTYNRVRNNQLSQSINIVTRAEGVPLVRNIRPHESQKRQWITSMSYSNAPSINPITLSYQDEQKRRHNEKEQELEEMKRDVFNLPDKVDPGEHVVDETKSDEDQKLTVTERLALKREKKFNEIWSEMLEKISEINRNLLKELEETTRICNSFYEKGEFDLDEFSKNSVFDREITSLTIKSFDDAFEFLKNFLPPRLAEIQDFCQRIEELEAERIEKTREVFKSFSEPLYESHHLSDTETASRLEKQATDLNKEILDNRRTYAELEARLLTGETLRVHRYEAEFSDYQNKWRDAVWKTQTEQWKNFLPPNSTTENARKWLEKGNRIVTKIVELRENLIDRMKQIAQEEIDFLQNESQILQDRIRTSQVYNDEQIENLIERDIQPIFDERKRFLNESIIQRCQNFYENSTNEMFKLLELLSTIIQPAAEQWDNHQTQLERVMAQLVEMMREYRRPFDVQNEKKLAKLDATLDEMRAASNEAALSRLLNSSYEQLDLLKANYAQFYDAEHGIVNKYPEMITKEVERYGNEMFTYFRARPVEIKEKEDKKYYTTILAGNIYELNDQVNEPFEPVGQPPPMSDVEKAKMLVKRRSRANIRSRLNSLVPEEKPEPVRTFLTEEILNEARETSENDREIPFYDFFRIPSDIGQTIVFQLRLAFLDYFDRWKEETTRRVEAVLHSKHEELDREMELQTHLHEPRRVRIETDIHNVRTAELVLHDERVERHIRGVQETLEQTDADYARLLAEFAKSIKTYRESIFALENVFINATTSARLNALQNRLTKQRDDYMENTRSALLNFRKRFDNSMQYLRQANIKFRKSFKMFNDGGNFSRDEIDVYRKKLERTTFQIDKAEAAILREMEKIEKKQLEDASKIMEQFQERFKNHLVDLQFIEMTNRWISDTQVRIKSEVALSNQQSLALKTLLINFQTQLDALAFPNLDKRPTTIVEVRDLFHQIIFSTYERALFLKCLNNELAIPSSILPRLKNKGLISEEELINDLHHVSSSEEINVSRRASRVSAGLASSSDEIKSVKFGASSSFIAGPLTRSKGDFSSSTMLNGTPREEFNTMASIRKLLHKNDQAETDEIVDNLETNETNKMIETASVGKQNSRSQGKKSTTIDGSPSDEGTRSDGPSRIRTRDEIYGLYCTFGEKKHNGEDFMSKILNILRSAVEGLLSHAELYYKEKGSRPATRPQAIREKFEEFARTMVAKLRNYEEQSRAYHEQSISELRSVLEQFERSSVLIGKIEFEQAFNQAIDSIRTSKGKFDEEINRQMTRSNDENEKNFDLLRPTFGQPARKNDLEQIDKQERSRLERIDQTIQQLRTSSLDELKTHGQGGVTSFASTAESLLILFDEILTADEVRRIKLPPIRQSLLELVRRQQTGRPLEDSEPVSLIERKAGHWAGLTMLFEVPTQRRESVNSKKRSSISSQKSKVSATIITQKTTLPQIETVHQRDQAYQRFKDFIGEILSNVEENCSAALFELERQRTHWNDSVEKLRHLRTI